MATATTTKTPAKPRTPKTTPPAPVLTEREQHEADVKYLATELAKAAKKHGLCAEFNTVMNRVNKKLAVKMPDEVINPKVSYEMPDISVILSGTWAGPATGQSHWGEGDSTLQKATKDHLINGLQQAIDAFLAGYTPHTGTLVGAKTERVTVSNYLYAKN